MSELAFNRAILERAVQILTTIVFGLIFLVILLISLLGVSINKPQRIVYENQGKLFPLEVVNYEINEKILINFVQWIAKEYFSFSPESLPKQIENIQEYLAVKPKNAILASYQRNKSIIQDGTFFNFDITSVVVTRKINPFDLKVVGVMTIIDKDGNYKTINKIYLFQVQQIKATKENPYGLKILQIEESLIEEEVKK